MQITGATSHKALKAGATLTGLAVFGITTLNVSASKFNSTAPLFPAKVSIFISRMFGPDIAKAIFSSYGTGAASVPTVAQGITPLGVFNQATGGGVLLLVADAIIKKFGIPYYTMLGPFIRAIGGGLLGGGIIGGLFDPDPSQAQSGGPSFLAPQYLMQPSQQSAPAQGLQPYRSATAVRLHGR